MEYFIGHLILSFWMIGQILYILEDKERNWVHYTGITCCIIVLLIVITAGFYG